MASIRHLIGKYYPKTVENVVARYEYLHGRAPTNVSHWDPSSDFVSLMDRTLSVPANGSAIPYLYAPDAQQIDAALRTIGTLSSAVMTTPSGTASIASALFWLASTSVRRLLIITPAYFSVGLLAEALGFDVQFATMVRVNNTYELPLIPSDVDAVWITNPLYCTTHYFTPSQLQTFRDLLEEDVYVIADEPMTYPHENAGSRLAGHKRFVGIYSPHKAIGINGLKCSLLAFDESVRRPMLDTFDAFVGGLPLSAMTAVAHLVSPNFLQCASAYDSFIAHAYERVRSVTAMFPTLSIDNFARTNFVSVFAARVDAKLGISAEFLTVASEATGTVAYPSIIHGYGEEAGFGFRVNLTAVSDPFIAALRRWCDFLNRQSSGPS